MGGVFRLDSSPAIVRTGNRIQRRQRCEPHRGAFDTEFKLDGRDVDRATKEAEAIGLRAPGLKAFALSYVSAER